MVVQLDRGPDAAAAPGRLLSRSLAETDPEVHSAIADELTRQQSTLEMIASENIDVVEQLAIDRLKALGGPRYPDLTAAM